MPITPINAEIPLQGVNPATTYGELMKADDLRSQAQYRQAQVPLLQKQGALAEAQTADTQSQARQRDLQNEQLQMDQDDQRKLKDYLMEDPSRAEALGRGDMNAFKSLGVQPKTLMGLQTFATTTRENLAKADTADLEVKQKEAAAVQPLLQSLALETDPAKRKELAASGFANLQRNGYLKHLSTAPDFDGSDAAVKDFQIKNGLAIGAADAEIARRKTTAEAKKIEAEVPKTQAEADKITADAAKLRAETPGAAAESSIKQNQAANMTPTGLTPQEQAQHEQAAAQLAETANYHKGELGLKAAANERENKIFEATYGAGANPALQGVEPKARSAASAQAQKIGLEYNTAQSAADEMQSLVDLMRKGNKVAYAYSPTTGVLTINSANGVKRVNMAEIEQYGGAGSALDHIKGWVGKQVSGESVPANIIDDMEQLHSQLSRNSYETYVNKLNTTNQVYRSNFQPATAPPKSALPGEPPKIKAGDTVMYGGKPHKVQAVNSDGKLVLEP